MKKKAFYLLGVIAACGFLFACNQGNTQPVIETIEVEDTQSEVTDENIDENDPDEGNETSGEETGSNEEVSNEESTCPLEDGVYIATFDTDSSMFHVNEMCDGKGELTVKDGEMSIHISLPSKSILNLYYGLAEDAQKEGAVLLEPTVDTIDYDDGTTEEVHGFDIKVPYLDEEFDVALIGKKGVWYDHKVSVKDPVLKSDVNNGANDDSPEVSEDVKVEEGEFTVEVTLEGGSGKATITSPCTIKSDDKGVIAVIEWSSPNYDYMIVDGEKYLPVNTEGNSLFEIPVKDINKPLEVIADTVAMSKPHEIEYTLKFNLDTLKEVE